MLYISNVGKCFFQIDHTISPGDVQYDDASMSAVTDKSGVKNFHRKVVRISKERVRIAWLSHHY